MRKIFNHAWNKFKRDTAGAKLNQLNSTESVYRQARLEHTSML